jgi:hypothetical protein
MVSWRSSGMGISVVESVAAGYLADIFLRVFYLLRGNHFCHQSEATPRQNHRRGKPLRDCHRCQCVLPGFPGVDLLNDDRIFR